MKRPMIRELDFEIDKLTNSIENSVTGEVFDTEITPLSLSDKRQIKKADWVFDWQKELKGNDRIVYKLTTVSNFGIVHGLISLSENPGHIFINLIESAKFNKGKKKQYKGIAGNLTAFACKASFEKGYEGFVSFIAKTRLIEHYKQTLGAQLFGGNMMFIDTPNAKKLVNMYFKNFDHGKF